MVSRRRGGERAQPRAGNPYNLRMVPPADPWRFCPRCGKGLEVREIDEGKAPRPLCNGCGFVAWQNPRVTAGAIFADESGIVLLRRALAPSRGLWTFPRGFVDLGETTQETAIRETLEETGVRIGLTGILDAYSSHSSDVVSIVYAGHILSGRPEPGAEALEVGSFAPELLPWDELAFESTLAALRDYIRRFFPRARVPRH